MSSQTGGKQSEYNWLATEEAPYGSPEFETVLAGKLADLTTGNIGPGAYLHYNNVGIAYTHLYGFDIEGVGANANQVSRSGDQGNIAELRVPANAGLLGKAWNIVVGPELTWSCEATTTDFASEAQSVTMRNALQYFWKHESVGQKAKLVMFEAMGFAEGALHVPWDETKGPAIGVEPGADGASDKLVHEGDMDFRRVATWDIIRDPTAKSFESQNWVIVREWPNKFDVAATCDTEEKRQACLSTGQNVASASPQTWVPFRATYNANTDRIPVFYLYCKRCPSVPGGRQTVFLQDGTVLRDEPLDEAYADLPNNCIGPVVRVSAGEYSGTPWPYTKWFGTLGAGQARDALFKDLLTNATAVSGSVISVEDNAMDSAMSMAVQTGGPQVVPRPAGSKPPEVLQLQQSHPEHFKLAGTLDNEAQKIMGIDNITAGLEVGANLSGAAMALMTSTSVQNNSQLQADWTNFTQGVGNVVLRHVQKHMKTPRRIALAGNSRSSLVTTTELSGDSVAGIQRVICTIGPALAQTDAGKYTLMETALKNKWVQTPEQAQTVLDTGRYDALTEDLSNELLLIKSENEALGKGEDVPVMLDDNHSLHLKSHRAVTSSLTARRDEKVVLALQAHQDSHIRALRETDPAILQLFGQPTIGTPGGGAPGGPPGGPPGAAPPMPPSAKPPQAEQQASAPSMPTNPSTGDKAGPVAGKPNPGLAIKGGIA